MLKTKGKLLNFEAIHCSSSSIIYKAFDVDLNKKVIIKTLNREIFDAKSLSKLKNEYKLLKKLQGEYVVHAYDFISVENRFSMVIEDFGGISLDQYINSTGRIDIREFLSVALKMTRCLDHLHKNKVIHKDINPSNIVYNPENKVLKLIDFGIASEFSFETMQALNPNSLEGRLSYISPEQTGRMNRPLDYRTDFYSLGVTLFELACKQLPFASKDPAEIVYFHIAGTPLPVHQINPEIPEAVSQIIMKLMAKMPEDRYKNAQGILFDLCKCIEQMNNRGVIEEFTLGSRDISDKFEVPKKLYGRESALAHLLTSFDNVRRENAEFILIGGYSGIGKTSLVNELHKPIMQEKGIFISGKYDQYNRNTPYSACFHAIDQFCRYILSEPEIKIENWKHKISKALGSNGKLITDAVPRLELILGDQPAIEELSPTEEQKRFKIALNNWLAVISSPEHPVVFFMDDVHWADMASLDLFESLLTDHSIKGLMFIGTYRDNEVDASHPLIRSLDKIHKNNGKIEFIKLENIDVYAVSQMIADIVSRPEQEVHQLAALVHEKTQGNPFYTIEFLKHCHDKGLLYYNESALKWDWNETGIYNSQISDNVADYLIEKIETLPAATRDLVKIAACIGNQFDIKLLSAIAGKDKESIQDELKPAIYEEMISVMGKNEDYTQELQFQFCHDRFQQAGYQALSEDVKKIIHLNIARYYEACEVLEGNYLFLVAEHYSKTLDSLVSKQEIEQVIKVFFKAAHAAYLSSAYNTSRQYLELIMDMVPEDLKNDSFLLHLYSEYHLVLYSLAIFDKVDQVYGFIEKIAKNPLDLVDACCIQLISLSNRSRYKEAFHLGINMLEKLGVEFPNNKLIDVIQKEYDKYYEFINNGSINTIVNKTILTDARDKAIIKILNDIHPAAMFHNPLTSFWTELLTTNLIVEKGITAEALESASGMMMGMVSIKNDFHGANMIFEKVMFIAEREGYVRQLYRMYHKNGLSRCHWFEPVERDIYFAHESFKGNLQNGEFEFSCYSFFTSQSAILECCTSLSEMQNEVETALSFAGRMGNLYGMESFVSFQQIVKALRGETFAYGSFNDHSFNEKSHVERIQHNAIGLAYYYIYRSLSAVIFGDFRTAFILTERAVPILPYVASFYIAALLRFLHSLSICKIIESSQTAEKQKALKSSLGKNQEWLCERAKDAPFNFQHLYDLVDAELKALEGKYNESFSLYEKAINGAKENKRPYHYALACELAGQRYQEIGIERIAGVYLKEAYSAYLAWGAVGKTEDMKEKYQQILFSGIENAKLAALSSGTVEFDSSTNMTALANSIDLNAIIRATQTISEEIEKKKLLEKLMGIIIENSGSNRGYILTSNDNCWNLSAYTVTNKTIKIFIDAQDIFLESQDSENVLPLSIVSFVMRTKEPVIIGNVQKSDFSLDKYFIERDTSSVLCFPVLFHNVLKGIIYLENDLLTEAFTKDRVQLLNICASQAAISLENSILYTGLEEKVKKRTEELQKANLILKERTAELAIAKEKTDTANKQLEKQNLQLQKQNLQLQNEVILRKQIEEELRLNLNRLRLSEERFGKLFHSSPVMMSIRTSDEEIYLDVNSRWEEITGYSRQEVVNRSLPDLGIWADSSRWPEVINELKEKGVEMHAERAIRTKNGEIRTFLVSQTVVNLNNEDCWLSACLDITERKKMEQEIARLDRLNLVGEMAASIGHEIRNPMTSVRGFLQMFKEKYSDDKEFLNLMIEELDRANEIITEFLSLAKNKMVKLIPTKLNVLLKNILPLIQASATIQDKIMNIEMEFIPDLLLDEKEIRQLILNLVRNGLESMPSGGVITIKTFTEKENAVLAIQDQGHGIDPKLLDKLGTPFITTKEQGTGLGLAVCYGIAKRHGASIDIETGASGTSVFVRFPLSCSQQINLTNSRDPRHLHPS